MQKTVIAAIATAMLSFGAYAQDATGTLAEAQTLLTTAGVNIEIPEYATDEQLGQIIELAQSGTDQTVLEAEVKKVLEME